MSHREPHATTEPTTGAAMGMRGCETSAECRSDRPGHGLHAMQERLAAATASKWIDLIVAGVDHDGFATLVDLEGADVRRVWHHDGFAGVLRAGEPVALHGVYGVLAVGDERFSVASA